MNTLKKTGKPKGQFGLFIFFVCGLFFLQIVFAFTIHGDIGPQNDIIPCIDKPASPFLVGRIDSLVSSSKLQVNRKVVPEGAFSPASREIIDERVVMIENTPSGADGQTVVRKTDEERFYHYTIRSGDTLEKISRQLYGNGRMVQSIVRINRIADEKTLPLGGSLLVPRSGLLNSIKVL
ncbi:MAG: LysM peptidoglycan-binding domain-containing protein [Candidatus Rifleibacteriota bacterium]